MVKFGSKKLIIVSAIAGAWVWMIGYNAGFLRHDRLHGALGNSSSGDAAEYASVPGSTSVGKQRHKYRGVIKNIFLPIREVRSAPPPVIAPPVEQPRVPTAIEVFAGQIRFMGFVERGIAKTVFIARGADVYLAKKGVLLDGRFRVADVTDEALVLKSDPDGQEVRVDFSAK